MRRFGVLLVAAGVAGAVAMSAGARVATPSGDTCTATGGNDVYTLDINVAANAAQYNYVPEPPAVTSSATIPGANGDFAEGSKPSNTNGQWLSDTPLTGSVDVTLNTSGTVTGPIMIVPGSSSLTHYWDPVTCRVSSSVAAHGLRIKLDKAVTSVSGGNGASA